MKHLQAKSCHINSDHKADCYIIFQKHNSEQKKIYQIAFTDTIDWVVENEISNISELPPKLMDWPTPVLLAYLFQEANRTFHLYNLFVRAKPESKAREIRRNLSSYMQWLADGANSSVYSNIDLRHEALRRRNHFFSGKVIKAPKRRKRTKNSKSKLQKVDY